MLKQSFSKAKKVLTILLAVLFVASLTVGAASACHSHGHHHSCDSCSSSGSICESDCCHTCSHGQCCNGVSCHKCSSKGETVCEC